MLRHHPEDIILIIGTSVSNLDHIGQTSIYLHVNNY